MKNEYTAYTREIDGQLFYFVKHFIVMPELQNVKPVQVGSGMHLQFDKACDIASITTDVEDRKRIYATIHPEEIPAAKVISINDFNKSAGKKIS